MLGCIIKQKRNNYYIYVKEKNNTAMISVVFSDGKRTKLLRKEEAKILFKMILSSKITYKESRDGYDVYLDEAGNKRFYKDGIENYSMFFYNNGVSAIEYDSKNKIGKRNIMESIKRFILLSGSATFLLTLSSSAVDIFHEHNLENIQYAEDSNLDKKVEQSYESIFMEDCKNYIYNSKFLNDNDKDLLYNEDLLQDVLAIADNSRNYNLREKLDNINIKIFEKNEENPGLRGYYAWSEPSNIYAVESALSNSNTYLDVVCHEFVHLLQSNNEYNYIREACAEIIKNEYYGLSISTYNDAVNNVKALMEIIGPEPILECNFNNDTSNFENAIKQYLEPNDANRLLSLFTTGADVFFTEEGKEIDEEIKSFIYSMYRNSDWSKESTKEETEMMLDSIYKGESDWRFYFNQREKYYYQDFKIKVEEPNNIYLDEVINSDLVSKCMYHDDIFLTEDEYNSLLDDNGQLDEEEYERSESGQRWKINNTEYVMVQKKTEVNDLKQFLANYEPSGTEIDGKIQPGCRMLHITFKDGTIGNVSYLNERGWTKVNKYYTVTSIKDKFNFNINREGYNNEKGVIEENSNKLINNREDDDYEL